MELWLWIAWAAGLVIAYELVRAVVVGWAKRRYERQVDSFLRSHKIPNDPFRHTHRVVVREQVLADPHLAALIADRAKEDGASFAETQAKVRAWLEEIVPQFNLLAYYKVGYNLGRTIAYSVYNVKLDQASLQRARAAIPPNASVVYVSNHRSNADFVVTGFMLSKSVQVSYAVGEWARVWPLESLFKAFGSYFVRRGEKDPLYHATLAAYLGLVTKQGVTQAMFPEGGLTRDGGLREAKVGLLDNMARAKLDPEFKRPLVFVPVGINFDRVIEDENMVAEAAGNQLYAKRTVGQKLARLGSLTWRVFVGGPVTLVRFATKRIKKHGVCAIQFGEPIVFDDWYASQTPFLDDPDRKARWDRLRPFADQLMAAIGSNVAVTPATWVCHAAHGLGESALRSGVDRGSLALAMRASLESFRAVHRPFAVDPYDDGPSASLRGELANVQDDLEDADLIDRTLTLGLEVLRPRSILTGDGPYRSERFDLVTYYAKSVESTPGPEASPEAPQDPVLASLG